MKAKFKKFLIDNGAYEKFVDNIKNKKNISFNETPEGFDYWDKLNEKWEKLLK